MDDAFDETFKVMPLSCLRHLMIVKAPFDDWLQRHGFTMPIETVDRTVIIMREMCQIIYVTPLSWACYLGHLMIAKALVAYGASARGIYGGRKDMASPLLMACFAGHVHVCHWLLAIGAPEDLNPAHSITPLYIACERGHQVLCELLIAQGSQVNDLGRWGRTPLWGACLGGHVAICELLVASGATFQGGDMDNGTPLHAACSRDNGAVVQWLLFRASFSNETCSPIQILLLKSPLAHSQRFTPTCSSIQILLLMRGLDNYCFDHGDRDGIYRTATAAQALMNLSVFDWEHDSMNPDLWTFLHVFLPATKQCCVDDSRSTALGIGGVLRSVLSYLHHGTSRAHLKKYLRWSRLRMYIAADARPDRSAVYGAHNRPGRPRPLCRL